ncbi:MAG: hypothetical protein LUD47_00540 [Clostridia bacterium]|nr:hypothetical protein [Clostridia bacterium]
MDRALNFNAEIPAEEVKERVVLPAGDYVFQVFDYKETHFNGNADFDIPACEQAEITLIVKHEDKTAFVNLNLRFLESKLPRISSFMRCVGLIKPGQGGNLQDLPKCKGLYGMANFTVSDDKRFNNVKYFRDYKPEYFADLAKAKAQEKKADDEEIPF